MQQGNKTSVTDSVIREKLIKDSEGKLYWHKYDLIDWFLKNFPVCSNLTVKGLVCIANHAGLRVI